MKLQEIKLYNRYRSLEPFPEGHQFLKHKLLKGKIDPIGLVGLNGSGKSNFLELLADIFFDIEVYFLHRLGLYIEESPNYFAYSNNKTKEPIYFEIRYKINVSNEEHEIKIIRIDKNKSEPHFYIKKRVKDFIFDEYEYIRISNGLEARKYMPLVVAYTSGLNDLLTLPFIDLQDYYAQQIARKAISNENSKQKIESANLLLLNYESNAAIIVSNFLLASNEKRKVFKETMRIERMNSFRIVIRLNKLYGNKKVKITNELKDYIDKLKDCAALSEIKYDNKNGDVYMLDFIVNNTTIDLFMEKFQNSPQKLFEALNKLNLLNTLCIQKTYRNILKNKREKGQLLKFPQTASLDKIFSIERIELVLTHPVVRTEYEKISDGEHQFIHIVGGIMLFDTQFPERDLLYLLDEPDTHFNPLWRSTFFYQLEEMLINKNIEFMLTTHSPFVLSDCHGYNVFKFTRYEDKVIFNRAKKETYGASFNAILEDIFYTQDEKYRNFNSQMAKTSYLEIEDLHNEIDSISTVDEWAIKSKELENKIRLLGESIDRLYLLNAYTDKEKLFIIEDN